jgi:hypothetical protein
MGQGGYVALIFSVNPVGISAVTESADKAIGTDDDVIAVFSEPNTIEYAHLLCAPHRCIAKADAQETEDEEASDIHFGPHEAIGAKEKSSVSGCPTEFISRFSREPDQSRVFPFLNEAERLRQSAAHAATWPLYENCILKRSADIHIGVLWRKSPRFDIVWDLSVGNQRDAMLKLVAILRKLLRDRESHCVVLSLSGASRRYKFILAVLDRK